MKNLELKKLAGSLVAVGMLAGFSLSAAAENCPETLDPAADYKCFFFDVGTSFSPNDTDSLTSSFWEVGYTGTLATSVYQAGLPNNSTIVDSNITTVLNYYGLSGGPTNYTTVGNTTVSLKDTAADPSERNIDGLNGPANNPPTYTRDTERFDPVDDLGGLGWGLTYSYVFTGSLTATGPEFTGGYLDWFFNDWTNDTSEQVLRVNITGSDLNLANLDIFGTATFDWTGGGNDIYGLPTLGDGMNDCISTLCQNFWNFQTTTPTSFFDLEGLGVLISMRLDTNVNPPIPALTQLVEFTGDDGDKYWIRQTTLDGSMRFTTVPEPGSLALLGLGLAGLAFSARRRTKKA